MFPRASLRITLLIPLVYLAACTGMRGQETGASDTALAPVQPNPNFVESTPPGQPAEMTDAVVAPESAEPVAPKVNPAVIALLDSAHADAGAGRLPAATASVERALRIEPRNPVLWQELAKLKLQKGEYQQAENFAARANSWAGSNKSLLAANWRIIGEARSLRGDDAGAKAALQRAKDLEQAATAPVAP